MMEHLQGGHSLWIFLISIWNLMLLGSGEGVSEIYENECSGAVSGLSPSGSPVTRYDSYREMYTNCTLVRENLEITFIEKPGEEYDFDFLESIREVNGYVLIYGNWVNRIRLSNLRVIRGWNTFSMLDSDPRKYSLYVVNNANHTNDPTGLRDLRLNSLTEILQGDVFFQGNTHLCYGENTINWAYIFHGRPGARVVTPDVDLNLKTHCDFKCHESCGNEGQRFCWGPGQDMCQTVVSCGKKCGKKRCISDSVCCDSQCVAGCSVPEDNAECLSCRDFVDNDECVKDCNADKWNRQKNKWERPTVKKYQYGTKCVEKCPVNMLLEEKACVSQCKPGNRENLNDTEKRECIPCDGPCPITCPGTDSWLKGDNIAHFNQCTKVQGNLIILLSTFKGHMEGGPGITLDDLELLKDVIEITGVLEISNPSHVNLTSLAFLRNLRVIGGQGSSNSIHSLKIMSTALESAELISLQEITKGNVYICENLRLCYVHTINWTSIFTNKDGPQRATVRRNRDNYTCIAENRVCSPMCSSLGCWGPGDDMCFSCLNYSKNSSCVADCPFESGFYKVQKDRNNECRSCHHECKGGCKEYGPDKCENCLHVKNDDSCEAACPFHRYKDENGTCQLCHGACDGCDGPSSKREAGGCTKCRSLVVMKETKECLMNGSECDNLENHYRDESDIQFATCRRCHKECNGCNASENTDCFQCRNYNQPKKSGKMKCVANCTYDDGYYNIEGLQCAPCDSECEQCYGPTDSQCTRCRRVRIYETKANTATKDISLQNTGSTFRCVEHCPNGYAHEKIENDTQFMCQSTQPALGKSTVSAIVSVLCIVIAAVVIFLIVFVRQQKLRRLRESVLANDEIPMISAGKAKPDMSLLRLIKESELRRGNIIGSGAFGTVFKGVWIPEKENIKIPVAIKLLQDTSNTNLNVELLDEARIMASVCHPYCVRILAVCMTAQMMLITQLMPLGCLLDYVRKEKSNIGSRTLLLWSVQIAKGMKYLEELGIVHRDLAARNVLVHNPNQVKITDFGLAKLLDCDEEELHLEGGKMPIKWLALECIQHRIYTHKSDVWSYGVTLWETFTYGDRPYENTPARQIPQALEKGERLPQPPICTIDVYMIMIKCWMLDVDSRPLFADLVTEFTRMAQDPGRFLVIPGDKLMRLPSSAPDAKDLIRLMSLPADEPDLMIVSGEEYLRPMELEFGREDSGGDYPPTKSPLGPLMSIPEDESYENTRTLSSDGDDDDIDKPTSKSDKKPFEYTRTPSSQRYISDPCRTDLQGNNQAYTNPVVQVDADGYLPPKSAAIPNYLDVVADDPSGKSLEPQQQQVPTYLDMSTTTGLSKDNPDYYSSAQNEEDGTYLNTGDISSSNVLLKNGTNKDSNPKQTEYYNVPGNPVKTSQPYARLPETDI